MKYKEMITEDYVNFETAKLLKEKGFDDTCRAFWKVWNSELHICSCCSSHVFEWCHNSMLEKYYNDDEEINIAAPTLQMAMKWLREEKDVQIEIPIVGTDTWESPTKWMYGFRCQTKDVIDRRNADFSSYEEACEAAIKYCLENLI